MFKNNNCKSHRRFDSFDVFLTDFLNVWKRRNNSSAWVYINVFRNRPFSFKSIQETIHFKELSIVLLFLSVTRHQNIYAVKRGKETVVVMSKVRNWYCCRNDRIHSPTVAEIGEEIWLLFCFNIWFLVHLSRRLKCTIVIMRCPSSVRPSLTFMFSTSSLKPLNGIQRNLTGSKISTSSTKFVFFGPIGKTRWPPWPLIGWNIFDFSSETAERNSTKLDRKQDLNVLYKVCVFRTVRKNKIAALASDWRGHFWLLLWTP